MDHDKDKRPLEDWPKIESDIREDNTGVLRPHILKVNERNLEETCSEQHQHLVFSIMPQNFKALRRGCSAAPDALALSLNVLNIAAPYAPIPGVGVAFSMAIAILNAVQVCSI